MIPAWHDKPTEPGRWVHVAEGGRGEGWLVYVHDARDIDALYRHDRGRFYGPIPIDTMKVPA